MLILSNNKDLSVKIPPIGVGAAEFAEMQRDESESGEDSNVPRGDIIDVSASDPTDDMSADQIEDLVKKGLVEP